MAGDGDVKKRELRSDPIAAQSLMRDEMRVHFAPVHENLTELLYEKSDFRMSEDAFVFITPGNVRFHYRRGAGITAELPGEEAQDEFQLYLWGTVFGAVAWLNDLFPLHASAVASGDRVIAFTAPSGGGKSTLAATLARMGFPHVCDDTLVLVPGDDAICGIPDGKPLKLWQEALALTETEPETPIHAVPGKYYARAAVSADRPLPLTDLMFLERGEEVRLTPITGAEKLPALASAIYRGFVHAARNDNGRHSQLMLDIPRKVRFWTLSRPFELPLFAQSIKDIYSLLSDMDS